MSGFKELLHRAEQHLMPESYDVCSILCGKTMELVLRELLQVYLRYATLEEQLSIRREITSLRKNSPESLTAGEMSTIFDKYNILRSFVSAHKIEMEDQRLPDLRTMVKIRNKATHDNANNSEMEKADAHVMYGSVLRLVGIADRLLSQLTRKESSEGDAVIHRTIARRRQLSVDVTAIASPRVQGNILNLYRNKVSGKYFIFLEEEEGAEKILLVIPTGQIKALYRNLFESEVAEEEEKAVSRGLILAEQAKCYHEYMGYEPPLQKSEGETVRPNPNQIIGPKGESEVVFTYEVHGVKASLVYKQGAYFVQKGSTALREERASITDSARKLRRDFLRKGILVPDHGTTRLIFTKDQSFNSPSAASGVVSASSTNGWICFKLPNGKTLKTILKRGRE